MKNVKLFQNSDNITSDTSVPWNTIQIKCVKILEIYCKTFGLLSIFLELARKFCTECKCERNAHELVPEYSSKSRLNSFGKTDHIDAKSLGYSWIPSGLSVKQIDIYFSQLPSNDIPRIGSFGERNRNKRIIIQLPKQDLSLNFCKHIEPANEIVFENFIKARNDVALDVGQVINLKKERYCTSCQQLMAVNNPVIYLTKKNELIWHPNCFRCNQCNDLLVDLIYCLYDNEIFCERHYAEKFKPRCSSCDELIFSGEYTRGMNQDYHGQHFCCWQCDESLTGQRYVLRDDHPYCVNCYQSVFANTCEKCNKIIGIDSKDLSYKDKHWHEICFTCTSCGESLVDKQFGSKNDRIYCGRCYDQQFASRCDGCHDVFRAGTKKMEYKTRQWHEQCFRCCVCKNPIGNNSFIPREQEIYCTNCYEESYATRCVKCQKIISSGGVTYRNEPWHRDCFICTHCGMSLAGQRFTSRDDKPYCAECFGELFAKRCTSCSRPITGIGGTRFISFEDRHWHNDCFQCVSCGTSLVGRGFITDDTDIICPDCAKQKLTM